MSENQMDIYPLIPLRALVTYPRMVLSFSVRREKSLAAIREAGKRDGRVFLVTQKDRTQREVGEDDLFTVGVVAKSTLAATNPVTTSLYVADEETIVEMVPQVPGQLDMDGQEESAAPMLKLIKAM